MTLRYMEYWCQDGWLSPPLSLIVRVFHFSHIQCLVEAPPAVSPSVQTCDEALYMKNRVQYISWYKILYTLAVARSCAHDLKSHS